MQSDTARDPTSPALGWRATLLALGRTLATGAIAGALGGLIVGGVLGRLAMRLLAVTSPASAQGGTTDDRATVGEISVGGTLTLTFFTVVFGVLGGLIYVWVRRVLPADRTARALRFGLLAGAVGGAFFVHDHPSFDYTALAPAWLAVALFVALPALFGVLVAILAEVLDAPTGWLRRAPTPLVLAVGTVLAIPTLLVSGLVIVVAAAVAVQPRLRELWRSHAVTVAGTALYVVLVAWGGYGLVVDIVSIATDSPSTAPLNP